MRLQDPGNSKNDLMRFCPPFLDRLLQFIDTEVEGVKTDLHQFERSMAREYSWVRQVTRLTPRVVQTHPNTPIILERVLDRLQRAMDLIFGGLGPRIENLKRKVTALHVIFHVKTETTGLEPAIQRVRILKEIYIRLELAKLALEVLRNCYNQCHLMLQEASDEFFKLKDICFGKPCPTPPWESF
jgi:hypothetical protein